MREALLAGRERRDERVSATLGLALAFGSWQHLVRREGLSDEAAVEILAGAVEAA